MIFYRRLAAFHDGCVVNPAGNRCGEDDEKQDDVPRQGRPEAVAKRGAARTPPRSGIAPWQPEPKARPK